MGMNKKTRDDMTKHKYEETSKKIIVKQKELDDVKKLHDEAFEERVDYVVQNCTLRRRNDVTRLWSPIQNITTTFKTLRSIIFTSLKDIQATYYVFKQDLVRHYMLDMPNLERPYKAEAFRVIFRQEKSKKVFKLV
jgi:hypothetical protein